MVQDWFFSGSSIMAVLKLSGGSVIAVLKLIDSEYNNIIIVFEFARHASYQMKSQLQTCGV